MSSPKPERLVTIAEFAGIVDRPRRTVFRQVLALHERHGGDWLVVNGMRCSGRKITINVSLLRKAHPALFATKYVTHDEVEELQTRLAIVEKRTRDSNVKLNATIARVRTVEKAVEAGQTRP